MPVCTSACKCSGGGCTLPGEQDEFSNAMAIGETEAHTVAVLVDEEEFPACVTPAFNGEDQVSSNIIYFIDILQVYKVCSASNSNLFMLLRCCQFYNSAAADRVLFAWELRETKAATKMVW